MNLSLETVKAPGCTRPICITRVLSYNTLGATFWTDGKVEGPMVPDQPGLLKSVAEGVLFWVDDCEEMPDFEPPEGKDPWEALAELNLDDSKEPSVADYRKALSSGMAITDERKRYIHTRLWWAGNNRIRRGKAAQLSAAHAKDLRTFGNLLSETNLNQRLMKAEILRELSRFDEALALLNFEFPEGYAHAAGFIRELAASRQAQVAKLPFT